MPKVLTFKFTNYFYLIFICTLVYSCNHQGKSDEKEAQSAADSLYALAERESLNATEEQESSILPSSNTWAFFYSSSEDNRNKSRFVNLLPTADGGCYFTTSGEANVNEGLRIVKKDICKLHKCSNMGEEEFTVNLTDNAWIMALTPQQNIFQASASKYQLLNSKGELIKEVPTEQANYFYPRGAYCFSENEFFVVGELDEKGFIYKFDKELNLVKKITFGTKPVQKSVFDQREGGFSDPSEVNSLTKSDDNNFYFTGRKKDLLWVGKLNSNLEIEWERNDYVFERTGSRPRKGSTIICGNNNEIYLSSSYSSTDNPSMVMCINSDGNAIWKTFVKGQIGNDRPSLIKLNHSLRLITYGSPSTFESSTSGSRANDHNLYSKIYHLTEKGEVKSEKDIIWDNLNLHASKILASTDSCYYIVGITDKSENDDNHSRKAILCKYNEDDLLSKRYTDLQEEDQTNSLEINLDFNDNQRLSQYLNYYEFRCYINNGYSTVMVFDPGPDGNTGKVTFTMFKMGKKGGGFDIVSNQMYNYTLDKSKVSSERKVYFKTNMHGLITLSADGELVMEDKARNEVYYYTKNDRH